MSDADGSGTQPDYLARVERQFGLRRGGRVVLSPRDWRLVQEWQERGVPVEVVLRGINRAFDLFDAGGPRRQSINSLSYCRQHVEEALARWTEQHAATGTSPDASPWAPAESHLLAAAQACTEAAAAAGAAALAAALADAAERLRGLAARARGGEATVAELDAAAHDIEQHLAASAEAAGQPAPRLPRFSPWQA